MSATIAIGVLFTAGAMASTASPAPSASPSPAVIVNPFTPKARMQIAREYLRAQKSEIKALEFRQKLELKELKASQQARFEEWKRKETEARHKYFEEHSSGPEKREYVINFVERRKAFLQILSDERNARIRDQQVRVESVKSDQAARLKEFIAYLDRGERPPQELWPQPGR